MNCLLILLGWLFKLLSAGGSLVHFVQCFIILLWIQFMRKGREQESSCDIPSNGPLNLCSVVESVRIICLLFLLYCRFMSRGGGQESSCDKPALAFQKSYAVFMSASFSFHA